MFNLVFFAVGGRVVEDFFFPLNVADWAHRVLNPDDLMPYMLGYWTGVKTIMATRHNCPGDLNNLKKLPLVLTSLQFCSVVGIGVGALLHVYFRTTTAPSFVPVHSHRHRAHRKVALGLDHTR